MTPLKLSFSLLVATLTACSTITEPLPAPDITEERLRTEIADTCHLVKERGGKYLKCENEGMFAVGDDCEIKKINLDRVLICEG